MAQTRYGRYADSVERKMMLYVLANCPAIGELLDVGCEGGRWSKVFADMGWQITATDVDTRALQVCQSRIPNARCVLADPKSRRLVAENESIDLALCIEVGPVVHTDWAISEFSRVLKIKGPSCCGMLEPKLLAWISPYHNVPRSSKFWLRSFSGLSNKVQEFSKANDQARISVRKGTRLRLGTISSDK